MKRKICIITGTRADYGIFYPVMKAIEKSRKLELYIIATGMHLMKEFGLTVKEIEKDGFSIYEKIDISYKEDTGQAMAISIGNAVSLFAKSFRRLNPDIVVVLGDRAEMLAAAIAANYMNIPVAHIHGGEVSGHVDGVVRHAITKLAHLHFASTRRSARRIGRLGEEAWRVSAVGAPALDNIFNNQITSREELLKKYRLDDRKPIGILLQHPIATAAAESAKQIAHTLKAIVTLKLQTVVIYPNADAGGRAMIKVLQKYKRYSFLRHFKSIPHKDYLGLLKIAGVLIGNSSSGIIEAPSFHLPVVNIGERQRGRERSANIIDVPCIQDVISGAIRQVLKNQEKIRGDVKRNGNVYGDGRAGSRIAKILESIPPDKRLLEKKITY